MSPDSQEGSADNQDEDSEEYESSHEKKQKKLFRASRNGEFAAETDSYLSGSEPDESSVRVKR